MSRRGLPIIAGMSSHRLHAFVDDELLRAPLTMDMALQSMIEGFQRGVSTLAPGERKVLSDLLLSVASQRPRMVERYVASLREQVYAEIGRPLPPRSAAAPGMALRSPPPAAALDALSLVDDAEVAVDVSLSHVVEAIRSVAEHELRELLAFTSAMEGDMDVGTDNNPFRAEIQGRAVWAAAQALPLSGGHQVAFMRHAAMPMAQTLRKTYAAACTRLENEGQEAAVYRTVIPPAGMRTRRVLDGSLTGSIGADGEPAVSTRSITGRLPPSDPAQASAEQQLVDLLGRLFEAMLSDRRLPAPLHAPISRLQAFVQKATLENPALVEQRDHPIWRFIDVLAHLGTVHPGPNESELEQLLRYVGKLLDQLGEEPSHTATLYSWAIERLEQWASKRLKDRIAAAAGRIATMQALEDKLSRPEATVSTMHGAIDATHLDTVPSALLDDTACTAEGNAARWARDLRTGQWVRLFHRGGWLHAQLLWPGERGEVWLFASGSSDETWAMRRSAMQLLREARLADVAAPRSLLADAMALLASRRAAAPAPALA